MYIWQVSIIHGRGLAGEWNNFQIHSWQKRLLHPHWRQKNQCGSNFCVSTWLKLAWYGPVIVPQRNPTQYRWSFPQINLHTVTTLNQYLHIFSKVFLIVRTMPRPTPMGIRHEVFALAREGIKQGAIAARVGLTRATVNRILKRHAATGSLVPGKSSGAPRKTTPRQDRALPRMVRQDRFLCARALTARMRNLYGMRAGRTTVNNRLLSRGYRHIDPQRGPCWLPTTVVSAWSGRRGGGTWQWPTGSMSSSVMSRDSNFTR